MKTAVLTLNVGSSSLKFSVFDVDTTGTLTIAARGEVDGIGTHPHLKAVLSDEKTHEVANSDLDDASSHDVAIHRVLRFLELHLGDRRIGAVGHRVVHGGTRFTAPVIATDHIIEQLERLIPLAPLHQPHNLTGITAARQLFPDALQVACFDTAFHHRHEWVATTFALPRNFYDSGVRRYGFHGLSYEYVLSEVTRSEPELAKARIVIAHLGNGSSMCAIKDGRSIDSTMGFSALDGLPMGTRCGQLDPGVLLHLMTDAGLGAAEIAELLYHKSGLKGLSGISSDVRDLLVAGSLEAHQSLEYFAYRARRELGGLAATLSGLDALIFCGGIGENAAPVRTQICSGLEWLGIDLDEKKNNANAPKISSPASRIPVMIIKTDEEAMLAHHAHSRTAQGA